MKKSLENLLEKQGITLLNSLSKEERRARTETIKACYREAGYDNLPHELITFLTLFDGKDIRRRDGYMVFISSQNLPPRQEMLYYESDAGVTELIPFGDVNADEVLCIDSVGSVWGVLDLTSWVPRKTYYHFYGGDLYTAIESMIKGKVEETIIRP
nr:MAG TPA: immunity protein [Caudoviricetes sp.]